MDLGKDAKSYHEEIARGQVNQAGGAFAPNNPFAEVRLFMRVLGDELPNIADARGELSLQVQRYIGLCQEELYELKEAAALPTHNLGEVMYKYAQVGDGAIDMIVVAIGVLHSLGLPAEEMWQEVHHRNMAKRGPDGAVVRRTFDNKILKPEGWTPPQHERIIAEAIVRGNDRLR